MLSLILPFHSDVGRLKDTLVFLKPILKQYKISEILLCHNGPTSLTAAQAQLEKVLPSEAKILHTERLGLGAGYRLGIQNATQTYCVLSASDLPFGVTDLDSFFKQNPLPSLAIGSKAHRDSKISGYGVKRKIASMGFWFLRAIFLGLDTPKDSQGSIIIETTLAKKLTQNIGAENYFFSVELITLAQRAGVKPIEIPVVLENHSGESSVSVLKDSWSLAKNVIVFSKKTRAASRKEKI